MVQYAQAQTAVGTYMQLVNAATAATESTAAHMDAATAATHTPTAISDMIAKNVVTGANDWDEALDEINKQSLIAINANATQITLQNNAATAATHTPAAISDMIAKNVATGANDWDEALDEINKQSLIAINANPTQITLQGNAATAATQATAAATEIGKVPRLSTAIAAGASARRTKGAATATTLDETLGATP